MSQHWLVRVLEGAGVIGVEIAPATPAVEAWKVALSASLGTEEELAQQVAGHFKLDVADLEHAQPTALRLIPERVARRYWIYPLRDDDRHLYVATIDPTAFDVEQAVGFASGRKPVFQIAGPAALLEAIDLGYTPNKVLGMLDGMDAEMADAVKVVEDLSPEVVMAQEAEARPSCA